MSDATTTLRALAAACEECHDLAQTAPRTCLDDQRRVLADALPGKRWDGHAATLRTMADAVEALEAERDEARAILTECVAEVEARGVDPSLAAAVREWLGVGDG